MTYHSQTQTRADWRSCKRYESLLIQAEMNQLNQFEEEEREEMQTWTLYGQRLLQKEPFWFHDAFPHYPPDESESFQQWYKLRLLWTRYGRYYMGWMN